MHCHRSQSQVKEDVKARLTQSATGSSGGEGPRNHIQVIANSGVASVLILLHYLQLRREGRLEQRGLCFPKYSDVLPVGIIAYVSHLQSARPALTLTETMLLLPPIRSPLSLESYLRLSPSSLPHHGAPFPQAQMEVSQPQALLLVCTVHSVSR